MITGKTILFGNNIDTDQIIGAHHLALPTIADMAPFAFEHHSQFTDGFRPGDIVVAGGNFGCGSSREQAVAVLQARGVGAVVAVSFARIFFRNAINLGLPVFECPAAAAIPAGQPIEIDHDRIRVPSTGESLPIVPWPPFIREIVAAGGIVAMLRQQDGA